MTSEIFSWGQAFLAQGTDHFLNKMLSIRKVRLLITSRCIAMQSYECVIISKMFLIYFISYGCNGGALVFLGGAEASASPSFALPMFITIKKNNNSASVFRCASCHCGWHRHTLAHPWLRPWATALLSIMNEILQLVIELRLCVLTAAPFESR